MVAIFYDVIPVSSILVANREIALNATLYDAR